MWWRLVRRCLEKWGCSVSPWWLSTSLMCCFTTVFVHACPDEAGGHQMLWCSDARMIDVVKLAEHQVAMLERQETSAYKCIVVPGICIFIIWSAALFFSCYVSPTMAQSKKEENTALMFRESASAGMVTTFPKTNVYGELLHILYLPLLVWNVADMLWMIIVKGLYLARKWNY